MAKKGKEPRNKSGPANNTLMKTKKMFWAHTKGYKDVLFTSVTAKDVAQFTDTI